jgi:hypothetical protein
MTTTFKRTHNPLIRSDVLDVFDDGKHVVQAVAARDVPDSVLVAFSRDGGHRWYGHHKSSATSLDEFEARMSKED